MNFLIFLVLYAQISDIHVHSVRTNARVQNNSTGVSVKISARGKVKSAPTAKRRSTWTSMMNTMHIATSLRRLPSNKSIQEQNERDPERILYLCVLSFLAQKRTRELSVQDVAEFDKIFQRMSRDGKLNMTGYKEAVKDWEKQLPDFDLQKMFGYFDFENDGTLNSEEFKQMAMAAILVLSDLERSDLIEAFAVLGGREGGLVSLEQLKLALTKFGEAPTDADLEQIAEEDFLKFDDFLEMMKFSRERVLREATHENTS